VSIWLKTKWTEGVLGSCPPVPGEGVPPKPGKHIRSMDRVLKLCGFFDLVKREIQVIDRREANKIFRSQVSALLQEQHPSCECCNQFTHTIAHHHDYNNLNDVIWLCRSCHLRVHGRDKNIKRNYQILKEMLPDTLALRVAPLISHLSQESQFITK